MRLDYSMVHPDWTKNVRPLGRSQKGEDVSLKWTFDNLGTTNKYYVEFGAIDGYQDCNTHYFREVEGWTGSFCWSLASGFLLLQMMKSI